MKQLLKPMKNKIPQIGFIFIFLLIQVYCDLTLPQYTADIVNIGIQNTNFQFIVDTGVMMLVMVAISALATIGVSYFSSRVASGYAKDLRKIIYNKVQEISEIYWLDFRNVRCNKEGDKAYYSEDWVRHANDYITYDIFSSNNKKGTSVFYFKGHISRGIYPIPKYNGALAAIETSTEISKFHLNSILNNFSGNFIVNFNNGQPSEDVQDDIERRMKAKFAGADNAGKFMIAFNDSKDNAVTVERIQDDNFDKKYDALRTSTFKEIFVAFRAIPQLFGYSLEGTGFNKQEFDEAYLLYAQTTVTPIQKDIKRCFNKIFGTDNSIEFIPFELESKALEEE